MDDTPGHSFAHSAVQVKRGLRLEMDDGQFQEWTRLLERCAGLHIAPERRSFLISGIRTRMRANGCGSSREYYERLIKQRSQAEEWSLLIDKLTVHETSFFRHQASMDLVNETLLQDPPEKEHDYFAWSVGCATGEETYSLAMQLDNHIGDAAQEYCFRVIGTDISTPAVRRARKGVYLNRRLIDVPLAFQERYCRKVSDRYFRITEELRGRVCFTRLNLRDLNNTPMPKFNLIFCQNLLIYYDRKRRLEIASDLARCLRSGGVLVLGVGELLDWRNSNMEKVRYPDTLAYRRMN